MISRLHCIDARDDAWSRAARRVVCLAAARQVLIHDDVLVASDVRDLQALALRLETGLSTSRRSWPWARGHNAGMVLVVRGQVETAP